MGAWRSMAALVAVGLIGACAAQPVAVTPSTSNASNRPCTSVALSASRPSPIGAGQAVVFTAAAEGCSHPEYRFVLADAAAAGGSVTQDWSPTSRWTWNTFGVASGRYTVRADARALAAGDAPPNASTYLAFAVTNGSEPAVPACKLPVSGTMSGSGGFIQMPSGTFTADPASSLAVPGQPDPSGLRRGLTYDPVHLKWLPVPRDWVMPDFSSYVYIGTDYPRVSNQPALHRVNVTSGADTQWTNGDELYGYPIALRPEGVYGAPGPEIITMIDAAGVQTTVDQGHSGQFAVITPSAIWATKWSTSPAGEYQLTVVQRINPQTQTASDWFQAGSETAVPIGVDGNGSPIIAVGEQLANARIAATQIWIAPQPSAGATPKGELIYSDAAHPLTIIGWPVVSAGAIWIETDEGLWVTQNAAPMTLVSKYSGYIAGGCL